MFKLLLTVIAVLALSTTASAQVRVRGYTTRQGTYVAPHYRSSPDSSVWNNYSTRGNVNPYTGRQGTVDPFSPYRSSGGIGLRVRPLQFNIPEIPEIPEIGSDWDE